MISDYRKKSFFRSRIFIIGLFIIALVISFAYGRAYLQESQVRKEIARLQNEVKNLEVKKMETLDVLKYVKSPAFAEEKARLELNLAKPGEKLTIVDSPLNAQNTGGQEKEKVVELDSIPNIIKWWQVFVSN